VQKYRTHATFHVTININVPSGSADAKRLALEVYREWERKVQPSFRDRRIFP
jgi:hypothetical protein